ncbi:MAG TPA: fumarylacetoacetate hydrolase family protein [Bacteroidia bacterium]|nr:fumarylacetoacetate hydrolase family protein [Bacteroidia bacterium]
MKIICIGRNYANHAKEMNSAVPEEPVFFMKPETALIKNNQPFYLPDFSKEIHHEVELVLKISKNGKNIDEKFAHKYYSEIGIGIDFTARDLQKKCKEKGLPWEIAKAFDGSAPISEFMPLSKLKSSEKINFHLDINNKTVQKGNSTDLIFSFNKVVSYVSKFVTLKTGDLIFTGTPEGVGAVSIGDVLDAYLENEKILSFEIK